MPLFSRPDGTLCKDVSPARRIMPFLMPTRNESAVYFTQQVDLTRTLPWLQDQAEKLGAKVTLFHVFAYAATRTLHARPRLNRFVAGSHLYQRKGIWFSYSAKKALNDDSPLVVIKRECNPEWTFADLVKTFSGDVREGKSDKLSHVDKELSLILALPAFLIRFIIRLQFRLYDWNLLPQAFIRPDPMFASMFIANLGSIKLEAASHHLYEYGNIPIFAVLGRIHKPVVADHDGNPVTRTMAEIKYTLDERTEDGLYCAQSLDLLRHMVEDPASHVK
jgi:hypothetical protein